MGIKIVFVLGVLLLVAWAIVKYRNLKGMQSHD